MGCTSWFSTGVQNARRALLGHTKGLWSSASYFQQWPARYLQETHQSGMKTTFSLPVFPQYSVVFCTSWLKSWQPQFKGTSKIKGSLALSFTYTNPSGGTHALLQFVPPTELRLGPCEMHKTLWEILQSFQVGESSDVAWGQRALGH